MLNWRWQKCSGQNTKLCFTHSCKKVRYFLLRMSTAANPTQRVATTTTATANSTSKKLWFSVVCGFWAGCCEVEDVGLRVSVGVGVGAGVWVGVGVGVGAGSVCTENKMRVDFPMFPTVSLA